MKKSTIILLIFALFVHSFYYGSDINKVGYYSTYPKKLRVGFGASINNNKYINPQNFFYSYNGALLGYPIELDQIEIHKGKSFELVACYNTPDKTDFYFGIGYMQKAYTILGHPVDKTSIPSYNQFDSIRRTSQYTGVRIPFGIRHYYLSNENNGAYLAIAFILEVAKLQKIYWETLSVDGQNISIDPGASQNERYPFLLLSPSMGFDINVFKGYQLNPEIYFDFPLQFGKNVHAIASAGIRLVIIQK